MLRCSASVLAHHAESVSIVNHDAELVFLLECCNLVEDSECSGHSEYTFCNEEDSATLIFSFFASPCKHSFAVLDVVVTELIFASHMQTYSVKKACMVFCVIHNDVMTAY